MVFGYGHVLMLVRFAGPESLRDYIEHPPIHELKPQSTQLIILTIKSHANGNTSNTVTHIVIVIKESSIISHGI